MVDLNYLLKLKVNLNYLLNSFFYIVPNTEFEFLFFLGINYLVHDYFTILLSYFEGFSCLSFLLKEELKFSFIMILFFAILF